LRTTHAEYRVCLDAIASSSDRELSRGDVVPMHRMPRVRRGGTPACRPQRAPGGNRWGRPHSWDSGREARRWIDPRTGEVREKEAPRRPGLSPSTRVLSDSGGTLSPEGVGRPSRRAWASSSSSPGNARRWPISPHRGGDYVVLAGSGRVKLDDELVELAPLGAVGVSPGVARCFQADPDGSSCSSSDRTSNRTVRWSTTSGASTACSRKSLASRPLRGWRRLVPSSSSSWPIATLSGG
jgi:hypothetical protein